MAGKEDFPQLDHDGPELVYQQIANHIAGQIERGELKPGQRLTAERELAEGYGVAYMTVRRAIRELRDRGVVTTVFGRGNYVAGPSA